MSEIEQIVSDTEKELLLKAFECYIKVENNNLTDADYKQLVEHLETLQTELEDDERWKEESFPDFVNDFKKNFELQWKNERACQSTTSSKGILRKNFVRDCLKNFFKGVERGIGFTVGTGLAGLTFEKMIELYNQGRLEKIDMEVVNQAIKDVKLQQDVDRSETYSIASIADNLVKNHFLNNEN